MVVKDCLVENASSGWRVAERDRGGPGEKAARGFVKALGDPVHTKRQGPQGAGDVVGVEPPTSPLQ